LHPHRGRSTQMIDFPERSILGLIALIGPPCTKRETTGRWPPFPLIYRFHIDNILIDFISCLITAMSSCSLTIRQHRRARPRACDCGQRSLKVHTLVRYRIRQGRGYLQDALGVVIHLREKETFYQGYPPSVSALEGIFYEGISKILPLFS
jgi:hypothetical protein